MSVLVLCIYDVHLLNPQSMDDLRIIRNASLEIYAMHL